MTLVLCEHPDNTGQATYLTALVVHHRPVYTDETPRLDPPLWWRQAGACWDGVVRSIQFVMPAFYCIVGAHFLHVHIPNAQLFQLVLQVLGRWPVP